jgi:hypothetical protein
MIGTSGHAWLNANKPRCTPIRTAPALEVSATSGDIIADDRGEERKRLAFSRKLGNASIVATRMYVIHGSFPSLPAQIDPGGLVIW